MSQIRMDELFKKTRALLERADSLAIGWETACSGGCSGCCRKISVPASLLEATLAADCLNQNNDKALKEALAKNIATAGKSYLAVMNNVEGDDLRVHLAAINKQLAACPFLIKGKCAIYSARPFACRAYFSRDSLDCFGCPPNSISSDPAFAAARNALHEELWELVEAYHDALPAELSPGIGVIYRLITIDGSSGEAMVMTPLGAMAVRR